MLERVFCDRSFGALGSRARHHTSTLWRAALVLTLALATLACTKASNDEVGVDAGSVLERDAATTRDATTLVSDAARVDAAADTGTARDRDASITTTPRDTGAEPAVPSDAGTQPALSDAGERTYSKDRAEFFGSPRCSSGFLLCEDFESESPGAKADTTVWQTADQRIVVDDTRAARGTRSLRVTTNSNEGTHFIRTNKFLAAAPDKHWGRLFFWVDTRPTKFSHWTVIEATGVHPLGGTARIRFGGIHVPNVENRLDFNYDIWGGRPANFHEVGYELVGQDTKDGMWHCLEWSFDIPGRDARLFRDGTEETKLRATKEIAGIALDFPKLDGLNIGMSIYQDIGGDSWKVWIDEIAVDDQRIGCSF